MGRLRKNEEKKKIVQWLVTGSSLHGLKNCLGGGGTGHTSRMKSPVLSPARSALLPGSTLSRYCRAGNSAEGRKSSSTAVAWVCAVKQIQKYKSSNFNSSDTALIPTHFLNNERNICSKFLSSILHVLKWKPRIFSPLHFWGVEWTNDPWLAKMTSREKN